MTNLNHPRIIESDPLVEAELDAAIDRHFSPRRHTRDFGDDAPIERAKEPMPFEPIWYQRRASVALCGGACRQGRDKCPTPDACRLPVESVTGARVGALLLLLSAVFVISAIAAVIAWWPA